MTQYYLFLRKSHGIDEVLEVPLVALRSARRDEPVREDFVLAGVDKVVACVRRDAGWAE